MSSDLVHTQVPEFKKSCGFKRTLRNLRNTYCIFFWERWAPFFCFPQIWYIHRGKINHILGEFFFSIRWEGVLNYFT